METPRWSRRVFSLVAGGLVALAAVGRSQAGSDLTSAISPAGLAFISAEIPAHLPKSFTNPGLTQQLLDCPLSDKNVTLAITNLQVKLDGTTVSVKSSPGKLSATVTTTASGSLKAAINDATCYFGGTLACNVAFSAKTASGTGVVTPVVANGKLTVPNTDVSVNLTGEQLNVTFSGCSILGDLLNLVVPYVKGYAADRVRAEIERIAEEQVSPLVEKSLASMTELSAEQNDIAFVAKLDSVLPSTSGVFAGVNLELTPKTQSTCTLAEASTIGKPAAGPDCQFEGEELAVAVPRETLARAIQSAWKGGQLCLPPEKLQQLGLPAAAPNLFGLLLGMTSVDSMALQIVKEPTIELIAGAEPRLKVVLEGTEIILQGSGSAGPTTVKIAFALDVEALVRLDPVNRSLMLEIIKMGPRDFALSATEQSGLTLDADTVKGIMDGTVLPMVAEQLGSVPLVSTILHRTGGVFDPYYIYISRAATTKDYITLWARVYRKPGEDKDPPSTTLLKQPDALTKAQLFTFVAQGKDDVTPFDLIRLQWQVDGGGWGKADFPRGLTIELTDGVHTVDVRAVDLNDNIDPKPVHASFTVDGLQPTVTITTTPPSPLEGSAITVEWQVSDNLSSGDEIEAKAKVTRTTEGAEVTVMDQQFQAGRVRAPLTGLPNGEYKVSVIARDKAGNTSVPASITFEVTGSSVPLDNPQQSSGGCSIAHQQGGSPAALLLVLALALVLELRRRAQP